MSTDPKDYSPFQRKCFMLMALTGFALLIVAILLLPPVGVISLGITAAATYGIFALTATLGAALTGVGGYFERRAEKHSTMVAGIGR